MKLVFTSYSGTPSFTNPAEWLQRINGYTGILEKLSEKYTVIGIERIDYDGELDRNGVKYIFTKQKKDVIRFPFKTHKLIAELKPDVVFVNGFVFPFQLLQLKMSLGKKTKIIVINRSEMPGRNWRKGLQRLADKYVDAYLFPSAGNGKLWVKNGNIAKEDKIFEAMHGSSSFKPGNKEYFREALGIHGKPLFLWVGRLDLNKDPVIVVKAFMCLLKRVPSATLYMIYQYDELLSQLKEIASDDPRVHFIGSKKHDELRSWYCAADFIISASHHEGGGIAVCEAMSCSCIPVVSNIESFRTLTANGKCGLLFQKGNEEDLLEKLLMAITLENESEQKKVLLQFEQELSFTAIANKIENMISKIV